MIVQALAGETFHKRAEGKLIQLASPIFDPAEARFIPTGIGDSDLRKQDRIVAERRKDDLVDQVIFAIDLLAKISCAKHSIEALCTARIIGAESGLTVGQITEPASKTAMLGRVVVQKFRRAFILPHPHVTIVGSQGNDS